MRARPPPSLAQSPHKQARRSSWPLRTVFSPVLLTSAAPIHLVFRDPEQVRKLAGWGLTQNDRASFVGWSQSLISLGF